MIKINLLPAKVRKTKGVQRLTTYAILGGSALAILLILLLLNLVALIKRAEVKIVKAETAAAQLAEVSRTVQGWAAGEKYADHLRARIRRFLPIQAVWISLLDELAALGREDLWFRKLATLPGAVGAPLRLELEGEAYNKISVADFLSALESSPRFYDVQLEALTDTQAEARTQVKFRICFSCRTEFFTGGNLP
ncbi:MAG: PilN domain-containing protein [Candidatus Firestonebacteria bacterium]|nr:PilN domain-containing protein [Candidatus Firestonebacteria bacterium]